MNLPGMYQLYTGDVTVSNMKEVADRGSSWHVIRSRSDMDEIFQHHERKSHSWLPVAADPSALSYASQIAAHGPKQLIIFDIYENNAYDIQLELKKKYPDLNLDSKNRFCP